MQQFGDGGRAAGSTCSKLSSTSSRCRSRKYSCSVACSGCAGVCAHAQHLGDGGQDEVGVDNRSQRDKVDAVDKVVKQVGGRLQRKARLADPAGTGEGEQAHIFLEEKLLDLGEAVAAAEEGAARQGEVVPHGGATIAQTCTDF